MRGFNCTCPGRGCNWPREQMCVRPTTLITWKTAPNGAGRGGPEREVRWGLWLSLLPGGGPASFIFGTWCWVGSGWRGRVVYLIYRPPLVETCSAGSRVQSLRPSCPPASRLPPASRRWAVTSLAFKALCDRLLPTDPVPPCSAPTVVMVLAQFVLGTLEGVPCGLSEALDASLCLCFTSFAFQKLFLLPGTKPSFPLLPLKSISVPPKGAFVLLG